MRKYLEANIEHNTLNMPKETWLKLRKKGIGGSDASSILNLNPYRSSVNVYMEKIDENIWQLKEDAVFYETEERVRKVWVVVIEYEIRERGKLPLYSYYIDSTTGEIIGGEMGDVLETERTIRNDPNNVIEK